MQYQKEILMVDYFYLADRAEICYSNGDYRGYCNACQKATVAMNGAIKAAQNILLHQ
jgi:hypothetical protein